MSFLPATTARLRPELVGHTTFNFTDRRVVYLLLGVIVLCGFGFRAYQLSAEGLSEDELNKLRAVEDYRARGLTSANGEHPMLMKALLTGSVVVAEKWNHTRFAKNPASHVEPETALRFPLVVFGALTSVLIFLVAAELFGDAVGLIAAALYAVDPAAISFNRIAKEDSLLLFFFLLANAFWLRGQRAAETDEPHHKRYYWATAAAFGAMLASKYLPHLLAVSAGYYKIFQEIPATRWRLGIRRWAVFVGVMGLAFLIFNPTILLPSTWHEMRAFASERRIGHDSYEFMSTLYRNQVTLWLAGVPWYFYFVFIFVKLPVLTVVAFLFGLPTLLKRKLGDGRYFIFFWLFFWFLPFSLLGGKFARYFTFALPVVLIVAALGVQAVGRYIATCLNRIKSSGRLKFAVQAILVAAMLLNSISAATLGAPYYRFYVNELGGGAEQAGRYFPHDEFYDASVREAAARVAKRARPGARVASETPGLFAHYAALVGRRDLVSVSLSDTAARSELAARDFIVVARGRRYFSNNQILDALEAAAQPIEQVKLGSTPSIQIYELDSQLLMKLEGALTSIADVGMRNLSIADLGMRNAD